MEGTIEHLDGITFEAVLNPDSDDALAPSQTIRLENLSRPNIGIIHN